MPLDDGLERRSWPLPGFPPHRLPSLDFPMDILGRDGTEELLQVVSWRPPGSNDQVTVFDGQVDIRAGLNSSLFSKRSRNPKAQAITLLLDFGLHEKLRVYIH